MAIQSSYTDRQLYEALKELDIIPLAQLDKVFHKSQEQEQHFCRALYSSGLIDEEDLGRTIANILNVPYIDLSQVAIDPDTLQVIPEIVAKKQQVIAYLEDKQGLHVATSNPDNPAFFQLLEKKVGKPVLLKFTTQIDINQALSLYIGQVNKTFEAIIERNLAKLEQEKDTEPPIIEIVDTIIKYAFKNNASDVHLEPVAEKSLVRFRIDGIMHDIVELPLNYYEQLVSRIKVMAKLRTDEHFKPQDGKISTQVEDQDIDIRVSVVPITNGEKVVMRLLSDSTRGLTLESLGLQDDALRKVRQAYEKSYGMVLVTGPTGAGKTTTLYAILQMLNQPEVNITTIEDPVEYDLHRVNQIQVNEKTGLTFSQGLRSIVRQDPDIILVGEIRDEDTASIAVNSAMTGHLVLSTLHTNDAATAIPRLMNLGVEPFLISSSVNVVVAQRLVRKICPNCRVSMEITYQPGEEIEIPAREAEDYQQKRLMSHLHDLNPEAVKKVFTPGEKKRVYYGKGCDACHQSGYLGRVGIYEVMVIDQKLEQAVKKGEDAGSIRKLALEKGMSTMLNDGLQKVMQGLTTLEELVRVINQ